MAKNFPGPYEVRIFYTASGEQHVQHLSLRVDGDPTPGTAFSGINALRRDDSPFALDSEVDDWITLIRELFNSTNTTFDYAELWKYEAESDNASFVSAYTIGVTGNSGSANVQAGELIYSFRTFEGGTMFVKFMEGVTAATTPKSYTDLNAANQAIIDAVQLGTSPWLGRDTSYPFAFNKAFPGQNEHLFKKRFGRI